MNKKNVDIVDALGECLEEIEAGRLTIEECLERYPDYAADLQELLATRQKLQKAPALQPAAAFRQQARTQLLSQLSTPTNKYPVFITVLVDQWMRFSAFRQRRRFSMAWLLLFVVAASVIAGGGTAIAADAAAPGDPLYSLDRSLEKVRAELTNSPEALLKLQLANAQERLTEAKKLANHRGESEFRQAFDGYGETMMATASTFKLVEGVDQANLDSIFERSLMEHDPQLAGLLSDDDPDGDETDPDDTDGDNQNEGDLDPDDPDADSSQDKDNYCPPEEGNPHPVAVQLSNSYSETISSTDVMDWFCGTDGQKGLGMGQIMLALRTEKLLIEAAEVGITSTEVITYATLLQMRHDGASWGHIWQCLEINGNGGCKLDELGGTKPGKPDDAGKPENAGKPEDKSTGPPDHSNRPDEPPGKSGEKNKGPDESKGNNGNGNGNGNGNKKKDK